MKFAATIALSAAAAQLVLAQPHGHAHHHKRHVQNVSVVKRALATVYVNEVGDVLSLDHVCSGLAANMLKFKDGHSPPDLCKPAPEAAPEPATEPATEPEPTITPATEPTSSAAGGAFYEASSTDESSAAEPTPTQESTPSPPAESPKESPEQNSYGGGQGIDADFPDGEIDCGTFPSDFGALPVRYLGMEGWIGIQKVSIANNFVQDIVTGIVGEGCAEGAMCSYACPPGYLKSQWPSTQGAKGESVGGLECSGGKLRLTNPELSKKLCIPGTGGVKVENKADKVVSVCRTDYPGTESETVPTVIYSHEKQELACPDSHSYYKWKGMYTSAQYYLNPIGVGPEEACQWGTKGSPTGNWAPINFGVSKKGKLPY